GGLLGRARTRGGPGVRPLAQAVPDPPGGLQRRRRASLVHRGPLAPPRGGGPGRGALAHGCGSPRPAAGSAPGGPASGLPPGVGQ
ncbi:hypothetical protein DF186_20375, partial [Enterococcus hirae]